MRLVRSSGRGHDEPVASFSHFEVIESIERSLDAFARDLLETNGMPAVVLTCLPFSHSACLTVGLLPAIVLGVSVLPAWLSGGEQELATHFAAHEVTGGSLRCCRHSEVVTTNSHSSLALSGR